MKNRRSILHAFIIGAAGLTVLPLTGVVAAPQKPKPAPKPTPAPKIIFVSAKSVILPSSTKGMFPQCSRATPQGLDGYWTPTAAQAAQLEKDFPQTFTYEHYSTPFKPAEYYRQYVGFTRKGRKFIYVNAFAARAAQEEGERWKTLPVNVCDGGSLFWGVEYDVTGKSFSHFASNGR